MKIKKLLAATLLSVCLTQSVDAVPAYPRPFKVQQADGSEITIRTKGDEWMHYSVTEDGFPLIYNKATGNYEYATVENGKVVSSNRIASDTANRSAADKQFLSTVNAQEVERLTVDTQLKKSIKNTGSNSNQAGVAKASAPMRALMNNFPHFGEQHSIVILVEFSDCSFTKMTDAKQYYTDALNKENFTSTNGANGSARDFFIASSKGQFSPTFDVYGPVKINYSQYAFGDGISETTPNFSAVVVDAVKALDDEIDFSQYDHDNDGYVDNIYFFYAGYGDADTGAQGRYIWPHKFDMRNWGVSLSTNDGVKIGGYNCSNEIDGQRRNYAAGIGTFVHEFGHCLGFMDHYNTDNSYDVATPGSWDTMANGSYNNNSNTPPLYSAYECAELEWTTLEELTLRADTVNVLTPYADTDKAYKVSVEGNPDEFFVFENRVQKGWDASLPAEGMLVWHIDYDYDAWAENDVNINSSHQRIDIVEANGLYSNYYYYLDGVPFPGSGNKSSYDFKSWNNKSAIYLDKIKKNGSNIEFIVKGSDQGLMAPEPTVSDVTHNSFTCSWPAVDKATAYVTSVKKVNADSTMTVVEGYEETSGTARSLSVTGLEPETTYEVAVASSNGTFITHDNTVRVTTEQIPFSERQVMNVKATEIDETSFTAEWDAVEDAQEYQATLNKLVYEGEKKSTVCDFTGSTLPSGWSTSSKLFATNSGFYGSAAPALDLRTNGGNIVATNGSTAISHIEFWMRAYQTSKNATLKIQRMADGAWTDTEEVALSDNDGQTYSFDFEPTTSVRLYFNRQSTSKGDVLIDDVTVSGNEIVRKPVTGYSPATTDKCSYTFTSLESSTEYGVTVTAVNNGQTSKASEETTLTTKTATGINAVSNNSADAEQSTYDLTGRRVSGNNIPAGVYIIKGNDTTVKVAK